MTDNAKRTSITTRPVTWIALALVLLGADFASGPRVQFPVLFALPVSLAGWFCGTRWAMALAICLSASRLGFHWVWVTPNSTTLALANAIANVSVGAMLAFLAARASRMQALERELRALEGILPICSFCKQMREPDGTWVRLEQYFASRADAQFSHGVCPKCAAQHYGPYLRKRMGESPPIR
jgi:hypothetical protein